ncbi:MAG: FAD-dependent oxidoreductase [Methanomassiliicoccales archaeon]|nr:FAD-dependent oxidoreductase [Methanomassiliicoccales archaeon]
MSMTPASAIPDKAAVLIIGGGVAGLSAANALLGQGVDVALVEAEDRLGGRVRRSGSVFPVLVSGSEVVAAMEARLRSSHRAHVMLESRVLSARRSGKGFEAEVESDHREGGPVARASIRADAVIVATGMEAVDAGQIPELGYPRIKDVVTSEGFEGLVGKGVLRRPSDGEHVRALAFVQCVGSRVQSRGVPYCSSVCCMNAMKWASAVRESDPSIETYVLYIDIRAHGKGYEDLYRRAREKGVRFIRGQPSMIRPVPGGPGILVCGENTLLKELYEIPVDLGVLNVGMRQWPETLALLEMLGVGVDHAGMPLSPGWEGVRTNTEGVFVAGCAEAPKDVRDSMAQGHAAAMAALEHLQGVQR